MEGCGEGAARNSQGQLGQVCLRGHEGRGGTGCVCETERERWGRRGRILLFGSRWKPLKDFELRSDTRSDWGLPRITIVCCMESGLNEKGQSRKASLEGVQRSRESRADGT